MLQDDLNLCQIQEQQARTKAKKGSNPKGVRVECVCAQRIAMLY